VNLSPAQVRHRLHQTKDASIDVSDGRIRMMVISMGGLLLSMEPLFMRWRNPHSRRHDDNAREELQL
jgi:hypothetical protein